MMQWLQRITCKFVTKADNLLSPTIHKDPFIIYINLRKCNKISKINASIIPHHRETLEEWIHRNASRSHSIWCPASPGKDLWWRRSQGQCRGWSYFLDFRSAPSTFWQSPFVEMLSAEMSDQSPGLKSELLCSPWVILRIQNCPRSGSGCLSKLLCKEASIDELLGVNLK